MSVRAISLVAVLALAIPITSSAGSQLTPEAIARLQAKMDDLDKEWFAERGLGHLSDGDRKTVRSLLDAAFARAFDQNALRAAAEWALRDQGYVPIRVDRGEVNGHTVVIIGEPDDVRMYAPFTGIMSGWRNGSHFAKKSFRGISEFIDDGGKRHELPYGTTWDFYPPFRRR